MARLEFRLSDEDKKKIQENAMSADLSVSDYVRKSALKLRLSRKMDVDPELLKALNKIGSNVNQIAKHANIEKMLDIECLQALRACEQDIKRLTEFWVSMAC